MKNFILSYWLGIVILFALFYWEQSPLSFHINNFQVNITSYFTSLLLAPGMMEANKIFISSSYVLVIEKACNGLIPYFFFLASIAAFPSTLKHKIKWAITGYIVISAINLFRIWFVTQFVLEEKNNFSLAHDYLGNGLLILTGLILFTSFIKTRKINTEEITSKISSEIRLF